MNIGYEGFLSSERLTIHEPSPRSAGHALGAMMKKQTQDALRSLWKQTKNAPESISQKALAYHRVARDLAQASIFVDGSVNYLNRYLEVLAGFCEGAAITLAEGVMLQVETSLGCQTMIVRDPALGTAFFHIEENTTDPRLQKLYRRLQSKKSSHDLSDPSLYAYRMVDMTIAGRQTSSFAYPGLCFGGPAMGVNHEAHTFVSVDTLYTRDTFAQPALWVNAIASMIFDIGHIPTIRLFVARLKKAGIHIAGGYAIHIAHSADGYSIEVGGDAVVEIEAETYGDKHIVAQANYPRSPTMMAHDLLTPPASGVKRWPSKYRQLYREMIRRQERLAQVGRAFDMQENLSSHKQLDRLVDILADPHGDIETFRSIKAYVGFVNPFRLGYAVGFLSSHATDVRFGKLTPEVGAHAPYRYWYGVDPDYDKKYAGIDLREEARAAHTTKNLI